MKTSWKRFSSSSLEDFLIKTNIFALVIRLQKDVLPRRLQDIFKTFWTRLQDAFKTSSRRLSKTSSKRLQDIFKISWKDVFKTFSRRIIRLNCLPRSRICLGHTFEKFMVSVEICKCDKHNSLGLVFHFTTSFSGCLQRRF